MNFDFPAERRISFKRKPSPVPGDLRIGWRLSLTLLMLFTSRGKKASLAKLNLLNDALRSEASRDKLAKILRGEVSSIEWRLRVEPAFGRNIDLLIGAGLANWVIADGKAALRLTEQGTQVAKLLSTNKEIFVEELSFLNKFSSHMTEAFVKQVLSANRENNA
ncbi:hypothetical protein [Roseibium sediminicola]|uniref:Uncharacterized protein n=1 Tax=Roseibium sediminicola TaxID=2933272 RepID=A0ABT0GT47_9HYPH|nr:hypothetical protein [Roseibium sp. CAU 1639]MCK7612252.1 hypothetical protein [Roseibium sp. CAU 1639]